MHLGLEKNRVLYKDMTASYCKTSNSTSGTQTSQMGYLLHLLKLGLTVAVLYNSALLPVLLSKTVPTFSTL